MVASVPAVPVTAVIARFSGVVAYADGSNGQFAGHLDDAGNIAVNSAVDSQETLYNVITDESWVESMLAQLTGAVTLTPPQTGDRKTPISMNAEISGRVSYADGTWGDFISQYISGLGAFMPVGGSGANWTAALASSTALSAIRALFVALVTTGNATVGAVTPT